ncbi:hypothetical protein NAT51_08930 [Flavobacterium amniphilum]|uniref:hypothetical protein n=1 Tax=Flavobacterium amniphilum TaxID=1834035 RepID=UPI00202A5440|nr:hypothetical protein [Flavobacterium amniphilum]MCL9805645.1 hypothetical protein [Flavobacterium amniphilum]
MRNVFIISLFAFCSQFSFSQTVCGVKEVETMVQKSVANSKEQDAKNEAKYQKALDELGKVKKWTESQKATYGLKLMGSKEIAVCEDNKKKLANDIMTLMMQADDKKETENNCKVIKQAEDVFNQMLEQNSNEWKIALDMISADYKATTKKELVIE